MKKVILLLSLLISVSVGNAAAIKPYPRGAVDSVYICESRSAYAYHAHVCKGLARCTHRVVKVSKAEAVRLGYKPCKICY